MATKQVSGMIVAGAAIAVILANMEASDRAPAPARPGPDCAALSTDDIRAFFQHTPCRTLHRTAHTTTLDNGAVVAVSVIRVGFPTEQQAAAFQALHRIHGNGDIEPAALPTHPGLRYTALNYGSTRTGTTVTFAETEAISGTVDAPTLDAIAERAARR
ncbi:hypothetical protein ACFQV2_24055 [Actinokineospora soli]|uniref:Uncharacterized protein n=1 Tax=Actinokineospora soli TaxID=1048753 RepID=A0ABW2TQJ5_9PSEU